MKRILVNSIENDLFHSAWELYLSAFPRNERRELEVQEKIFSNKDYFFEVIVIDEQFIGFLAWWEFEDLRYIEHFATLDQYRGKGYGRKILKQFISENTKQTILEVELPNSEIDKRRIGFYERLNFKLNLYKYEQMPYRINGEKVELLIMSCPKTIDEVTLRQFESEFRAKCYNPYFKDLSI